MSDDEREVPGNVRQRLKLPARFRVKNTLDFERIYAAKNRAGDDHLLVFGARNELGFTRFGLSVSRKQGNAVRRARLKRLLREAFRLSQHELPAGLDLIFIPRVGVASSLEDYRRSLVRAAEKLHRRLGGAGA